MQFSRDASFLVSSKFMEKLQRKDVSKDFTQDK